MRYLVLLSLLLQLVLACPLAALEVPPNVRWEHEMTVTQTSTRTYVTDCKPLSNGNLVIVGQFTGTDSILGSPYDSASQPTNGLFVAVQSTSGELLWLHRFAGLGCAPRLGLDQADNIHLIGLAITEINLLGTTLTVEPDSILIYQLCLKADGTLGYLRNMGKMAGSESYDYFPSLKTLCMPLADGSLISLEFQKSININDVSYDSEDEATGMLWIKLDQQNETVWTHCFSAIFNASPSPLIKSSTGGYLGFTYLLPEGKFNGQPYSVSEDLRDSLMVWLDNDGQVTKTARLHGDADPIFTGVAYTSDGDLFVTMAGHYEGVIETSGSAPLEINLGPPPDQYGANLIIARIAGDLSAIRWQKGTKTTPAFGIGMGLSGGQDDSLYVAIQSWPPLILGSEVFKGNLPTYPPYQTALIKIDLDGQLKWVRFDESPYPEAFSVAPDGTAYLAEKRLVSYASSLTFSPPEFHITPLTNHLAAAGSTLYFSPDVNGAADTVYYWYKDGVLLTNSTVSSLAISNLSSADLGSYTITASNQFGLASAGPFTFTLGPSFLLSRVETMGVVDAAIQFRPDAKFSPDGRKHLIVGATPYAFTQGTNYYVPNYPFSTLCFTADSTGASNLFLASPSMTGPNPHAAIASDGSCFIANLGTKSGTTCSWLASYDLIGNEQWAYSYDNDGSADVVVHKDTTIYVATGCAAGSTFGSTTLTEKGLYLLKFSLDGTPLGADLLFSATNGLSVYGLRLASDGSGYVHGQTSGNLTLPDESVITAAPDSMFLVHFDASSQFVWYKPVPSETYVRPIACDTKGVVMGANQPDLSSSDTQPPVENLNPENKSATKLVRWHRDGTLDWYQTIYSSSYFIDCISLALDPSGNVIAGFATDGKIDLGHIQLPTNSLSYASSSFSILQGSMVRFSSRGSPIDAMLIPADYIADTYCMDIDPKGRLLFVGLAGAINAAHQTKIQMGPFLQQHSGVGNIFYGITNPLGPALVTEQTENQLKLNWSEYLPDFTLESSPSPTGPWTPVDTSTNSITLDAGSSDKQFFRLKQNAD